MLGIFIYSPTLAATIRRSFSGTLRLLCIYPFYCPSTTTVYKGATQISQQAAAEAIYASFQHCSLSHSLSPSLFTEPLPFSITSAAEPKPRPAYTYPFRQTALALNAAFTPKVELVKVILRLKGDVVYLCDLSPERQLSLLLCTMEITAISALYLLCVLCEMSEPQMLSCLGSWHHKSQDTAQWISQTPSGSALRTTAACSATSG